MIINNGWKLFYVSTPDAPQREVGAPQRLQAGVPLRAQLARNQRNRARNAQADVANVNQAQVAANDSGDSDDGNVDVSGFEGEKMGAKKKAKLEAKAEKKAQREAELNFREDKKLRDEKLADEQRKRDEQERLDEQKQEEVERLARELKEKEEHEAYLQMKAAFSVEEEGFDETESKESDNLLQEFIDHIKQNKVVVLEDLSRTFNMKTKMAIDRIQDLKANGTLTGVLDDRGKFIYISPEELQLVAKFIRQRGRIAITELAECSNKLINLAPSTVA